MFSSRAAEVVPRHKLVEGLRGVAIGEAAERLRLVPRAFFDQNASYPAAAK